MISHQITDYLSEVLQGRRTSDDVRFILREGEDGEAQEVEFDRVLREVAYKIPGITLDFEKLIEGDPIECDPLVSQGNLAILRLDAVYYQAFNAWTNSGSSLHTFKSTTIPENPTDYSDRIVKHQRSDETYPPDAQLLNQVVNITLSGFRIQATITHRRDKLKSGDQSDQPVSRDATRSASSPQQTNAEPQITSHSSLDIIDENEIFNSDSDNLSTPIEGNIPLLIRGFNKIGILKGYDQIEPLIKTATVAVGSAARSETESANKTPPESTEAELATESRSVLSAPPCDTFFWPANNTSQDSREEEPVTHRPQNNPSSPADHWPLITGHSPPAYHKRE